MANEDGIQNVMTSVAETVGGALGTVAGQADAIKAAHPHPVDEVRELVAKSGKKAAAATKTVKTRVKAAVKTVKKTARRATRKSAKVVKKARRAASAARKRTTKAARKTVRKTKKKAVKAVRRARRARRR